MRSLSGEEQQEIILKSLRDDSYIKIYFQNYHDLEKQFLLIKVAE